MKTSERTLVHVSELDYFCNKHMSAPQNFGAHSLWVFCFVGLLGKNVIWVLFEISTTVNKKTELQCVMTSMGHVHITSCGFVGVVVIV